MTKRVALLTVFLALGAVVLAHDMWLESTVFITKPGETITISNGNGTIYTKSENAVTPDRIVQLVATGPTGAPTALGTPYVQGDWLKLDFEPSETGNYWIGMATKPRLIRLSGEDFNGYLEHDGIPHVLEERKKKGILDREEVERYSKYVKIYLLSGEAPSDNHDRPLGLAIEILPLENPYRLKPGDQLPVQVLFQGQPLSGFALHAGYSGQEQEAVHQFTDAQGKAVVPIASAGRWYVRGIHLRQVDLEDHSYESHWATLTFEVTG